MIAHTRAAVLLYSWRLEEYLKAKASFQVDLLFEGADTRLQEAHARWLRKLR